MVDRLLNQSNFRESSDVERVKESETPELIKVDSVPDCCTTEEDGDSQFQLLMGNTRSCETCYTQVTLALDMCTDRMEPDQDSEADSRKSRSRVRSKA